jgi:hypothetical protein
MTTKERLTNYFLFAGGSWMQGGDDDPGTALNSKFEFDNQSMMDPEVE